MDSTSWLLLGLGVIFFLCGIFIALGNLPESAYDDELYGDQDFDEGDKK